MMINKRLIGTVRESKKYIAGNVAAQWISLAANIAMMTVLISLLASLFTRTADTGSMILTAAAAAMAIAVRFLCAVTASRMSLTSEAVQVAVEGIDQLETYFGAYLPSFFMPCWRLLRSLRICVS